MAGYTSDYIGQLCRAKKIDAKVVGRGWYVSEKDLVEHKNSHHQSLRDQKNRFSSKKLKFKKLQFQKAEDTETPLIHRILVKPKKTLKDHKLITEWENRKNLEKSRIAELGSKSILYIKDDRELFPNLNKKIDPKSIEFVALETIERSVKKPRQISVFEKFAVSASLASIAILLIGALFFENSNISLIKPLRITKKTGQELSLLYSPYLKTVAAGYKEFEKNISHLNSQGNQLASSVLSVESWRYAANWFKDIGYRIIKPWLLQDEQVFVDGSLFLPDTSSKNISSVTPVAGDNPPSPPYIKGGTGPGPDSAPATSGKQALAVNITGVAKDYVDFKIAELKNWFLISPLAPNVNRYYVTKQNDVIVSRSSGSVTNVTNTTTGVSTVAELTDVTLASVAYGDLLMYNGTDWVNTATSSLGITGTGASFGQSWEINSFGALAPTTTLGILVNASSTIGNGTQTSGLTISGGATTTGNAYFAGKIGISTTSPFAQLSVNSEAGYSAFVVGSSTATSLIVDKNGYVGIGRANPSYTLHVLGTVRLAGGTYAGYIDVAKNSGDATTAVGVDIYGGTNNSGIEGGHLQVGGGANTWGGGISKLLGGDAAGSSPGGNVEIQGGNSASGVDGNVLLAATIGKVGIGTTTPSWLLNPYSSTASQLALSAGAGLSQWAFRNAGGNLSFATTTVAGTATTSISALEIAGDGFGTTTVRGLNIQGLATSTSNVGWNITSGCFAIGGTCLSASGLGALTSYDAWTHPSAGISATTSALSFPYSSSTIYSSFATASTTNLIINGSSFNNLLGSGLSNSGNALTVSGLTTSNLASANISQWTNDAGYVSYAWPFTSTGTYVSTSTTLGLLNGFFSTASSTLSGDTYLPSLSQGFAYTGSAGKINTIASSSVNLSWFNNDSGFLTSATGLTSYDAWTHPAVGYSATTSSLAIGTSSTWAKLSVSSYSDGANTAPLFVVASSTGTGATSTTFIIDAVGNVGIGTTGPTSKLEVAGAGKFTGDASSVGVYLGSGLAMRNTDLTTGGVWYFDSNQIDFRNPAASYASVMKINNGNVGIGNTGPTYKLDVSGTSRVTGEASFSNLVRGTASGAGTIDLDYGGTTDTIRLGFTDAAGLITIKDNGNVGIGTTTPQYRLTVASSTALTDGAGIAQWVTRNAGGNLYFATTTVDGTATTSISALEIAGDGFGTTTIRGLNISGQATTTSNVGINLSAGCFAIGGTCLSTGGGLSSYDAWTHPSYGGSATTSLLTLSDGFLATASSTIVGNATTTGTFAVGSYLSVGTSSPFAQLSVNSEAGYPAFVVGSSTATSLIVDKSGNVGIGTTNPWRKLTVSGGDMALEIGKTYRWDTTAGVYAGGITVRDDNYNMGFFTQADGGNARVTIQNDGNVGIGTTTPVYRLTVASSTALTDGAGIAQWVTRNAGGNFYLSTTTVAGTATTSISALEISGSGFGTTTVRGLNISGQATTTSNVGIDLSAGCFAIGGNCLTSGTGLSSYDAWTHPAAGYSATTSSLAIGTTSAWAKLSVSSYSDGANTAPLFVVASSTGTSATTTAFIIDSIGNVGIGTANPSYLLDVSGSFNAGVGTLAYLSISPDQGATSYSNTGGQGNRQSMITLTPDVGLFTALDLTEHLNGVYDNGDYIPNGTGFIGKALVIEFNVAYVIDELKVVGEFANSQGTWQMYGSQNGTDYTTVGSTFAITVNSGAAFTNTTPYRFYKMVGSSGTVTQTWWHELEFKISSLVADTIALTNTGLSSFGKVITSGNVGLGTTTTSWLLNPYSSTASQLALSAGAGLNQWAFRNAGGNLYFATTTVDGTATTSISALEIAGDGFGTTTVRGLNIQGQATSTSNVGINLSAGCFAIGGNCVGGGSFTNTLASGGTATTTFYNGGIVFASSTGSGLLSQSSSAENFFWDETNKRLGLSTSTPFAKLSVNSIGGEPAFVVGSSTKTSFIVDANGNVGIGTASPANPLYVQGRSSTEASAVLASSQENIVTLLNNRPSGNSIKNEINFNDEGGVHWRLGNDLSAAGAEEFRLINNWVGGTPFYASATGASGIDSKVGIFSTSPAAKLSVQGGAGSTIDLFDVASSSGESYLRVANSGFVGIGTTTPVYRLTVASSTALTDGAGIAQWVTRNAGGNLYFATTTVDGTATTSTSALTILNNGNVGIGIANPNQRFLVAKDDENTAFSVSSLGAVTVGATFQDVSTIYGGYGEYRVNSTGAIGFSGSQAYNALDTAISRGAANKIYVGNGTAGDYSGTLIASNVGIGTTTPVYRLTVASSTALTDGAGIAQWVTRNAGGNLYFATTTVDGTATTSISALEIAGDGFGTTTVRGLNIQGQATSTSNVGINLSAGCFAIGGNCIGGGSFTNTLASGGTATTTFYNGGIVFASSTGSGLLSQSASAENFFWDETNKRLGLGTSTPFAKLSVNSIGGEPAFIVGSSTATSLIVDKNGYVGVGTANPIDYLSFGVTPVANNTRTMINLSNTALVNSTAFPVSSNGVYMGANPAAFTGDWFNFQIANKTVARLTGTTLVVGGQAAGAIRIDSAQSTSATNGQLSFFDQNSTTRNMFALTYNNNAAGAGHLLKIQRDNGGTLADAMVFNTVGDIGIGTSTPKYLLTIASTTGSQLALSAGAGVAQWTFRNAGGTLYLSTTTVAGTATTSISAFEIAGDGAGTTTVRALKVVNDMLVTAATSTFTGAIQVGRIATNDSATAGLVIGSTSTPQIIGLDTINNRVQVGDGSGTANPKLLVVDTKNTSGDPTGVNGAIYYNSNSNLLRCYVNNAWTSCGTATTTRAVALLNAFTQPDTSGNSWFQPYSITAVNDNFNHMVAVASSTAAKTGFYGTFHVPVDYTGAPEVKIYWTAPITTGDTVFDFDYRAIGGDDTESLDQATFQESVTATDTAPSAVDERNIVTLPLTAGNFAAGDTVEFYLARDGADVADTLASDTIITDAVFQYSN